MKKNYHTQSSKSTFARLLASENLTVIHKDIPTAAFAPVSRELFLPLWDDMSDSLYNLLVAHEVGHALDTPREAYEEANMKALLDSIDPKNHAGVHSFLNVVEDARIERNQKRRYPGLRKDFIAGYKELMNSEKDFFGLKGNPINERMLIDRINIHEKAGVLALVTFTKEEKVFVDMVEKTQTWEDVVEVTRKLYKHAQDTNDFQNASKDDVPAEFYSSGKGVPCSETDNTWELRRHELVLDKGNGVRYIDIPRKPAEIISFASVQDELGPWLRDNSAAINEALSRFQAKNRNNVLYMVNEFETLKAAIMSNRAVQAQTGNLNMNTLHTYKFNEDVFVRTTVSPTGKNHGVQLVIDWSSSMSRNMPGTLEQAMNLVIFCQKVNIPCEVFAFSDSYNHPWHTGGKPVAKTDDTTPNTASYHDLYLLQFSAAGKQNYKKAMEILMAMHMHFDGVSMSNTNWTSRYGLGGTPLNMAIVAMVRLINAMQQNNKIEIMSTVFLTDGASNPGLDVNDSKGNKETINLGNLVLRDPITRGQHKIESTDDILRFLKDCTDTNLIGFFLADEYHVPANLKTDFYKKGFALDRENTGYDEHYYLTPDLKIDNTAMSTAPADAAAVAARFNKHMESIKNKRPILKSVVARISKHL